MTTLAKFQMSYAFDPSRHPRDNAGRFAAGGGSSDGAPSFRQVHLSEASAGPDRRSLTRGEGWQRVGAKLSELPIEYTGSRDREAPVDGWKELSVTHQVPKAMPVQEHIKLLGALKRIISTQREGAITKAQETRQNVAVHGMKDRFTLKRRTGDLILDPATPKGAINRAYNHASMLALHDFGAIDYGPFKMSDAQKDELTPLVPFMRYVRRRLGDAMRRGDMKGKSRPYLAEFGKPFADNRTDTRTGAVRLRVRPNAEFVKLADVGTLAKVFAEGKHPRDDDGRFTSIGQGVQAAVGAAAGLATTEAMGSPVIARLHQANNNLSRALGNYSEANFRLAARKSGAVRQDARAQEVLRSQAKLLNGFSRSASHKAGAFAIGAGLYTLGDYIGDRIGTAIAGDNADTGLYRHMNATGFIVGGLGAAGVHGLISSRFARKFLRRTPRIGKGALAALGVGLISGSELVGTHAQDRTGEAISPSVQKLADVGTLAKLTPGDVRTAASRAAINPTRAQADAGNYAKGHIRVGGLDMAIESKKGAIRRGTDPGGKRWQVKMPAHYGYVKRTLGHDGDHVDVYLGPLAHQADKHPVHVVYQHDANTGAFDEHKAMLGFHSRKAAIATYDAGFSDGKGPQRRKAVATMPFDTFKAWATSDKPAQQPLAKRAPGCVDDRVHQMAGHATKILRRVGKKRRRGIMDPAVAAVMGEVNATLGTHQAQTPIQRLDTNEMIRNPRVPLAHLLRA